MKTVLVIGASGFVGRYLTKALLAEGLTVRCLARDPSRVQDLVALGCEIAKGDISDLATLQKALESVQAVYIAIHTLSPQPGSTTERFMAVERKGVENIVMACQANSARRLIYITSLGTAPDASSEWLRERWQAEQFLLNCGLDVTVIRPGMVVGMAGHGFGMLARQARKPVAILLGGQQKMRTIAVDDLIYYLVGVLGNPQAYQQCYDVGNDDVLTSGQMLDTVAEVLGRRHSTKLRIPRSLLSLLAPAIERAVKLPRGGIKGFLDGVDSDASGDPLPIRAILPQPLLSFRQAVERALVVQEKK